MPCPLTARSRFELVNSMLPCANCCETAATRTPLPLALLDTPCSDTANRSANSVREPLKPLVCVLAMLFAVTLRSDCAALRPERAMRKGMGDSCELEDALDVVHGDIAQRIGGQHETAVVRVERYARDPGRDAGRQRDVVIADLGDDLDL